MPDEKTLAFLADCPTKNKIMLFPGWYEDLKEEIDEKYEPADPELILSIGWSASLVNSKFIVFKKKKNEHKD